MPVNKIIYIRRHTGDVVPDDHLFVMGVNNRKGSEVSRYIGAIPMGEALYSVILGINETTYVSPSSMMLD